MAQLVLYSADTQSFVHLPVCPLNHTVRLPPEVLSGNLVYTAQVTAQQDNGDTTTPRAHPNVCASHQYEGFIHGAVFTYDIPYHALT